MCDRLLPYDRKQPMGHTFMQRTANMMHRMGISDDNDSIIV